MSATFNTCILRTGHVNINAYAICEPLTTINVKIDKCELPTFY